MRYDAPQPITQKDDKYEEQQIGVTIALIVGLEFSKLRTYKSCSHCSLISCNNARKPLRNLLVLGWETSLEVDGILYWLGRWVWGLWMIDILSFLVVLFDFWIVAPWLGRTHIAYNI